MDGCREALVINFLTLMTSTYYSLIRDRPGRKEDDYFYAKKRKKFNLTLLNHIPDLIYHARLRTGGHSCLGQSHRSTGSKKLGMTIHDLISH
jgi:hypothetical protein